MMNYFSFCPHCGSHNFQNIQFTNEYRCQDCDFVYYQNPALTVGAIFINDKKELLLTKRAFPPYKNFWDIPGGFVAIAETPIQALKREMMEELSIKITVKNIIGFYPGVYGQNHLPIICLYYLADINKKDYIHLKPQDDVAEAKWFPLAQLPHEIAFLDTFTPLYEDLKRIITSH